MLSNPYQPPEPQESQSDPVEVGRSSKVPGVSTANTIIPRHLAAALDNLIAMILALLAGAAIGDELPLLQLAALVGCFLGYYLLFEGTLARTPGKFIAGLVVVQYSGAPVTFRQTLIRTAFRILEVNPLLCGAIPAALSIVLSTHHQRFGDRIAGTIVVRRR
jgi:uncharacterized RDD family membrane protein YckC